MSQERGQNIVSFKAAASIPAYTPVYISAANTVHAVDTTLASIVVVGVSADAASTNGSVPVIISGTAKVIANSAIAAGAVVGVNTNGTCTTGASTVATATALGLNIGIALEAATATDAVIEVLLQLQPSRITL